MNQKQVNNATNRRAFIGSIATGAAAVGLTTLASPLQALAKARPSSFNNPEDPDEWFKQIKGKHRILFDVTEPNGANPFAWPRVFLLTNAVTGTPEKENSVVVVLRHDGIPYAMNSAAWTKYNFGKMFKINDEKTNEPALRNAFYKPGAGDFKVPGIGEVSIGINELQDSGVLFCVCNMAMTVYSAVAAQMMGLRKEDVYNDFKAAILPGIQLVPSGVWAVGRAQEHGCSYCKA